MHTKKLIRNRTKKRIMAILLSVAVTFSNQTNVFATQTEWTNEEDISVAENNKIIENDTSVSGNQMVETDEDNANTEDMNQDSASEEDIHTSDVDGDNTDEDFEYVSNYIDLDVPLPSKITHKMLESAEEIQIDTATELPSAYRSDQIDTNGDGIADKSNLPALRDQGIYGTCWSFSAIGACEASLISKGLASNDINLSESHLAYFFFKKSESIGDSLGNIVGDYNRNVSTNYLQQGGSSFYTMWQLASWAGPVYESMDDTFVYENLRQNYVLEQNQASSSLEMENTTQNIYEKDAFHLQNCYIISSDDWDTMKYFIMQQGALGISYYSTSGTTAASYDSIAAGNDNGDEGCYYNYSNTSTNHAVQVVGWDDDYPASNFVTTPEGNGAWLIKNSWGEESSSGLAQDGYFWLSYYDTSYANNYVYIYDCESADNYDHIYQYDGSGSAYICQSVYETANLFEVSANENEQLEAVSIGVDTSYPNSTNNYVLEIYVYDTDESEPLLSSEYLTSTQTGSFTYNGYHTIKLESPVVLKKGQKYAILFRFPTGAYVLTDQTKSSSAINFYTSESTGQSFYRLSSNGSWTDVANSGSTFRIKGFTNDTTEISITGVSLNKSSLTLEKGNSETLVATVLPTNTTESKTVTWSSSNTSVATVTSAGEVTAMGAGNATITASCGGKTATCTVTVSVPISGISLNKSTLTLEKGTSETLTATVLPTDTTESTTVSWSSSNTSVATVTSAGLITAVGAGSTTITASCGGKTATCTVTVSIPITSISLNKSTLTLEKGTSETLTATVLPTDTTESTTVSWGSSNTSVATVTSAGKVTAVGAGSATITANCGGKTATCSVTVSVPITSVSLNKTTLALEKGTSETLTATVLPTDTTESTTVSWSSSNTSVATVTSAGLITAIGAGSTTITASCGGKTATCTVTVSVPITSVTLNQSTLTLIRGNSEKLIATVLPIDTTESTILSWSSSDTSVATVTSAGEVTAVGVGAATITVTCGGKTAICDITVTEQEGILYSGKDGDLDWSIDEEGALLISGTGNYKSHAWTAYADSITSATIDVDGITNTSYMFSGLSNIESIDTTNFDTSNVTNMSCMFYGCQSLSNLDVSNFKTNNVTDMTSMFYGCASLENLAVSDFETSNVTNMRFMFHGCKNLKSLDVSNFKTDKVENMWYMFNSCISLENIDVSGFNTSNVEYMNCMFGNCSNLKSLDISGFDTSKVTDMSYMFYGCSNLSSLDVSKFDTSKVVDFGCMFEWCSNLESIDLSSFKLNDTANATNIFYACSELRKIVLPKEITINVSIYTPSGYAWIDENGTVCTTAATGLAETMTYSRISSASTSIEGITLAPTTAVLDKDETITLDATVESTQTISNPTLTWTSSDESVAMVEDGVVTTTGYGTATIIVTTENLKTASCQITVQEEPPTATIALSEANMDLEKGDQKQITATTTGGYTNSVVTWKSSNEEVATVSDSGLIEAVGAGTATITANFAGVTQSCTVTVSIPVTSVILNKRTLTLEKGNSEVLTVTVQTTDTTENTDVIWESSDTSVATVTSAGEVTAIGVGTTTITATCGGKTATCTVTVSISITSVTLDQSTLTLVRGDSEKLTATVLPSDTTESTILSWSSSDTSVATVTSAGEVTAVGVGSATITVTCGGKTATCDITVTEQEGILYSGKDGDLDWSIDEEGALLISGTGNYKNHAWTAYADYITSATIDVDGITYTSNMFSGLSNIESIDTTNFDTSNVTTMSCMFYGCKSLSDLNVSNFKTNNVTNMASMFYCCESLEKLDVSGFETSNVTDMRLMFQGCENLKSLDVSNFKTDKVENMWYMFNSCASLENIDVSGFNTSNVEYMKYMFCNCSSLKSLDISGFDTSKVTDMSYMFYGCRNLSSLDVSKFDTSNVTNMNCMFQWCSNLESIDLSSFKLNDTANATNIFNACITLHKIVMPKEITANVSIYTPSGYAWIDENGTVCTTATTGLAETMTYTRISSASTSIEGITLAPTTAVLDKDETITLDVTVESTQTISNPTLTWTSSDESVATVEDGVVTTTGYGTATITVTTENLKMASCQITVQEEAPEATLSLSETTVDLDKGSKKQLTATTTGGYTNSAVTWESSNEEVATVSDSGLIEAVGAGTATITANFAGITQSCTVTVSVPITSVTLNKSALTLQKGNSETLTVTVLPADTTENTEVAWTSSNTSVATVTSAGLVTAVGVGTTTITATCGEKTATCTVTVSIPITSVTLSQNSLTLVRGDSEKLTATVLPSDTTESIIFSWSSSDTSVATVTSAGEVTAVGVGSATITVACGEKSATCDITVTEQEGILYSGKDGDLDWSIDEDGALLISGTGNYESHAWTEYADYITSATVNVSGITSTSYMFKDCKNLKSIDLTNLNTSKVYSMYAMFYECNSLSELDVSNFDTSNVKYMGFMFSFCESLSSLDVTKFDTSKVVDFGCMFQLCSNLKSIDLSSFTINSTADTSHIFNICSELREIVMPKEITANVSLYTPSGYAWIDENGTVCTTATTGLTEAMTYTRISSASTSIEGITLAPTTAVLDKDETITLDATVESTQTISNPTLTWTSSDESVATVEDGVVTTTGYGTATITVTTENLKKASCQITVQEEAPAATLSLSEAAVDLDKGSKKQLTATTTGGYTNSAVTWESSNEDVATVSDSGIIEAVGAGTATITANFAGITQSCTVTVSVPITSVTLNKSALTLQKGNSETLTVTVLPADTTENTEVAWTSSNTSVATVTSAGLVTAVGVGTTTITATCGEKTATCTVTVSIPITSVTLDQSTLTLVKGDSEKLTATVLPSDTSESTIFSWSSSDTSVATVTSAGEVTAVGAGTASITITCGGKSAICVVTVTIPITNISLNKSTLTLEKGNSETLTVTVLPVDTTENTEVAWTSSNTSVATVTSAGLVTAVGAGTTSITATCGEKTATCTVTVNVPITSISLNKGTLTLEKGITETLTATVLPTDTTESTEVAWTSSDTSVVTVTSTGEVTAVEAGTAQITVSCGNWSAICEITVTEKEGILYSGTDGDLDWTIDTDGVLTISGNGDYAKHTWTQYADEITSAVVKVSGITSTSQMFKNCVNLKSVDTTHFDTSEVTDMSNMFYYCNSLKELDVANFDTSKVTNMSKMFYHCESLEELDVRDFDTSSATNLDRMFYYCSKLEIMDLSSFTLKDTTSATSMFFGCTELSKITMPKEVTASVSFYKPTNYLWIDENGTKCTIATTNLSDNMTYIRISSSSQYIDGITLDYGEVTLAKNEEMLLTATVEASVSSSTYEIIWSSSDETVATVANGVVTTIGYGTATITATTENLKKASCQITVQEEPPTATIALSEANVDLEKGEQKQITATTTGGYTNSVVTWESSNEEVATVSDSGLIEAVGAGTATITANFAGITQSCTITVSVPVTSVTLNKSTLALEKGNSETLTVTVLPIDTTKNTEVTWTSSNTSVATVTSAGLVTAVGAGTTTIRATCGGKTASCSVTVNVPITNINLNKNTLILEKGSSETLTASVLPSDTTESAIFTWNSSDNAVATVTSAGEVTAIGVGTATITVSFGEKTAICIITVQDAEESETPEDPTTPEDPVTPADPTTPEDPATPTDPATPENPTTPTEPTTPATPESSGNNNNITSDESVQTPNVNEGQVEEESQFQEGDSITDSDSGADYVVTSMDEEGGTVEYAGVSESKKTIQIPDTITVDSKTFKVTSIAESAFEDDTKLTKVTIGSNITSIGSNAFYGCKNLTTVTMGKNVTKIGARAFYKCIKLKKITIPSKINSIGKQAFYGCKKLKSITIKTTKLSNKKVGSKAFKGIYAKAKIKVPKSKLKAYKKLLKAKGVTSKAKIKK